jgi:hypothetical protein
VQQPVRQRRFAVVDMGDDTEVANMVSGHFGREYTAFSPGCAG